MRRIKFLISVGLFLGDGFLDWLARIFGIKRKPRCVILYYHSVLAGQKEHFARQLDVVLKHARPFDPVSNHELQWGERYVAITFDDANANIITNALPALRERKIPTAIFVISDRLGVIPDWENFGPDYTPEERTMTVEQLKSLPRDLIRFGSHTMTHPILTSVDEVKAREELAASRQKLEQLLEQPVRAFSFPYGAYNQQLIGWCRDAGYERIFTTDPVFALRESKEFVVGRMAAEPTDSALEFRMKLAGAYRWVKAASDLKQKLRRTLRPAGV